MWRTRSTEFISDGIVFSRGILMGCVALAGRRYGNYLTALDLDATSGSICDRYLSKCLAIRLSRVSSQSEVFIWRRAKVVVINRALAALDDFFIVEG